MGIKISIEGRANVGKTSVLQVIARALASEGFTDVEIVTPDKDVRLKEAEYREHFDRLRAGASVVFTNKIILSEQCRYYDPTQPIVLGASHGHVKTIDKDLL